MIRVFLVLVGALVVPLAFLLFIQWPLRDWLQDYSRQANDFGQILFAIYVAVAITAATLSKSHLTITHPVRNKKHAGVKLRPMFNFFCIAPWAMLVLWISVPQLVESIATNERFGETFTPGYSLIRFALVLLAFLALSESVIRLVKSFYQKQ